MARGKNPYAGQYAPGATSLSAKQFKEMLKGASKPNQPNKHKTTTAYKTNLKKEMSSPSE